MSAPDTQRMWDDVQLLARIVEHTPVAIIVTRTDGRILYVNQCGGEMLKIDRPRLLGAPMSNYITHLEGDLSWYAIHEMLMRGESRQVTGALVCGDGEECVCTIKAFSITTNDSPVAHIYMFIDETEGLSKAEQIESKNVEMARMNSELIRSNSELKKLSELKSSFLSIASHELKTPLTTIKGYSDIIIDGMRDRLDGDVLRMVENINRAADRLHRVVNNILDVTRIEQKRLRLHLEYLKLGALARECIDELTSLAAGRGITFGFQCPESLPDFYGDKLRLHQVFTNLLSNAIKFSPDNSSVEIGIALEEESQFHIVIRDHGIGIDRDEQKRIFDPFYEIGSINRHSTGSSRFLGGGTGLGLSIVKGVVDCHGGRLWVESDGVNKETFPGSSFHIVLPVRSKNSLEEDETEPLVVTAVDAEGRDGDESSPVDAKPDILFVDNDRESIEIARMVLDTAFNVIVAESGEQGLAAAFGRHPSLILLSPAQPGIDGFRICKILKSQEDTRNIPVAFFSSGADGEDIQKYFACGADDCIVKPFNGGDLFEKIWRILMKKKEDATFK